MNRIKAFIQCFAFVVCVYSEWIDQNEFDDVDELYLLSDSFWAFVVGFIMRKQSIKIHRVTKVQWKKHHGVTKKGQRWLIMDSTVDVKNCIAVNDLYFPKWRKIYDAYTSY